MNQGKFTTIQILTVFLLIFSFTVPMFDLWAGIMPSEDAWSLEDTFESLEYLGDGGRWIGELLHLTTWIPAVLLLITSLIKKKWGIIVSSALGIILPAKVLFDKVVDLYGYEDFWEGLEKYMNFDDGNICIGYYICLALFALCFLVACTIRRNVPYFSTRYPGQPALTQPPSCKYVCGNCGREMAAYEQVCSACRSSLKIRVQ